MVPDLSQLAGFWQPVGAVHVPAGVGWESILPADPERWFVAFASRDASWFVTPFPNGDFDGPDWICPAGGNFHMDYQKYGNLVQLELFAHNLTGGLKLSVWVNKWKSPEE